MFKIFPTISKGTEGIYSHKEFARAVMYGQNLAPTYNSTQQIPREPTPKPIDVVPQSSNGPALGYTDDSTRSTRDIMIDLGIDMDYAPVASTNAKHSHWHTCRVLAVLGACFGIAAVIFLVGFYLFSIFSKRGQK